MRRNVIETVVGGVVLSVAVAFLWFAYSGTQVKQGGYPLHARFDRIDGLNVGSDVKISGVKVGTVSQQRIDPKTFSAEVQISIDPSIQLPVDSSAEIVGEGLMGPKYLALVPGGDDEVLKSGELIKHTQSAISLEAMIGQVIFNKDQSKKTDEKDPKPTPSAPTEPTEPRP